MLVEKVTIPKTMYEQMIEHGRKGLPYEACGMLSGKKDYIQSLWPLNNELTSNKRFFVSKKVVEEILQKIDQRNEEVIGIYHTHPITKPIPSNFDLVNHVDGRVKMVIISYQTEFPIAKCYRITDLHYEKCLFWIDSTC